MIESGELHFSPYDRDPNKHINSIGRAALNASVIEAALRYSNVSVHFNHQCTEVDLDSAIARFTDSSVAVSGPRVAGGERVVEARGDAIIGVDGAFSAVRQSMQRQLPNFRYDESYLAHGYKELTIPPASDGSWRMEKNALHIWPRKSFMMIALPNPDGSFTCTLFWEFKGPRSFETTTTNDEVRRFFDGEFPDAVPLMPELLEEFRENPTGSLVTIRCAPWCYGDKIALVGDAAHAVVPFYGQGMNAAFEDCVVLDECLAAFPENRERAFAEYFQRRKVNADALAASRGGRTSSRCATRPRRKGSGQRRSSIIFSKPLCRGFICRFTPWSPSLAFRTRRQPGALGSRTESFTGSLASSWF